jgi:hypothetical protein
VDAPRASDRNGIQAIFAPKKVSQVFTLCTLIDQLALHGPVNPAILLLGGEKTKHQMLPNARYWQELTSFRATRDLRHFSEAGRLGTIVA